MPSHPARIIKEPKCLLARVCICSPDRAINFQFLPRHYGRCTNMATSV